MVTDRYIKYDDNQVLSKDYFENKFINPTINDDNMYSCLMYILFNEVFTIIKFFESFNKLICGKYCWDRQVNKIPINHIIYFINKEDRALYKSIFLKKEINDTIEFMCEQLKIKLEIIWAHSYDNTNLGEFMDTLDDIKDNQENFMKEFYEYQKDSREFFKNINNQLKSD
jgi:hypothetical protein